MGGTNLANLVKPPKDGYMSMADKGVQVAEDRWQKTFLQSFYAGCYIGFGGQLAITIAGNMKGITDASPAVRAWVFAALFPVNLFLIQLTGALLFTGATFYMPVAWIEGRLGKHGWIQCLKVILLTWVGNLIGGVAFANFTTVCGLNTGTTAEFAMQMTVRKCNLTFGEVVVRGIGCNWMVCMAVYISGLAQDVSSKYVAIFLPISTFVACGFEHLPANAYSLPLGIMAGADVTVGQMIGMNWIPSTIGNWISGSVIMAMGYSFLYGSLGEFYFKMQDKLLGVKQAKSPTASPRNNQRPEAPGAPAEQAKAVEQMVEVAPNAKQ